MKNLRRKFERYCFTHRDWGVPNLMLYLSLGSGLVYLFTMISQSPVLYYWLHFNRELILRGQLWRLVTYPLTYSAGSVFWTLLGLFCYYSLGRAMEHVWGTFRFNLFYFSGVLLMDVYCLIFNCQADVYYLNMSLFLAYATMYPNAQFLLLFIIPIGAWVLALFNLVLVAMGVFVYSFPENLFPVIALANYFLFFGKEVLNVIPVSWRANIRRLFRKKKTYAPTGKVIPFPKAGSYEAEVASVKAPYNHRCTVCGRTDISNPELEFRYCSRCSGYHCYCQEHISSHAHIQ